MNDVVQPVNWQVESIDEFTGEVVVNFTNGIRTNKIKYIWMGDQTALEETINADALQMAHMWMCSPIHSGIKSQIMQLSGSVTSQDTILLDDAIYSILKPDII